LDVSQKKQPRRNNSVQPSAKKKQPETTLTKPQEEESNAAELLKFLRAKYMAETALTEEDIKSVRSWLTAIPNRNINQTVIPRRNINQTDSLQNTALHYAVRIKELPTAKEIVRGLLDKGADLESDFSMNSCQETVLHWALGNSSPKTMKEIVTMLIKHLNRKSMANHKVGMPGKTAMQANIANFLNKRNNIGWTALHFAVANINRDKDLDEVKEVVKILLDQGADVNRINDDGQTPLHLIAILNKNPEIAKAIAVMLIDHLKQKGTAENVSKFLNIRDKKRRTALDLAKEYSNETVIQLLQQFQG
jgi:ankyrin repeat protein